MSKQKNCSNCGDGFTCGAEDEAERCWCAALPHLPLTAIASRNCLCPSCLSAVIKTAIQLGGPAGDQSMYSAENRAVEPLQAMTKTLPGSLVEGADYYSEGGMIVFTASYHRRRGYCCESGCRHCPYKD